MKKTCFKERFSEILRRKQISQTELSKMTNIAQTTLSDWHNGKSSPRQDKIDILAKALSVNPMWLLGYDVPMEEERKEDTPKFKILARNFEKLNEKDKATIIKMIEVMIEEPDDNDYKG